MNTLHTSTIKLQAQHKSPHHNNDEIFKQFEEKTMSRTDWKKQCNTNTPRTPRRRRGCVSHGGGNLPPASFGDADDDNNNRNNNSSLTVDDNNNNAATTAVEFVFNTNHTMARNRYYLRKDRNITIVCAMADGVEDRTNLLDSVGFVWNARKK